MPPEKGQDEKNQKKLRARAATTAINPALSAARPVSAINTEDPVTGIAAMNTSGEELLPGEVVEIAEKMFPS
jgi:hypothetical protein